MAPNERSSSCEVSLSNKEARLYAPCPYLLITCSSRGGQGEEAIASSGEFVQLSFVREGGGGGQVENWLKVTSCFMSIFWM